MTAALQLKIVTPERVVLEQTVQSVTVPTQQGEITILPNHVPLVSLLAPGELNARGTTADGAVTMAVSGGWIEVGNNRVVVLADTAEHAAEIDEARADAARQRAATLLTDVRNQDDVAYAALAAKIEKELARVRVARKHKSNHLPMP